MTTAQRSVHTGSNTVAVNAAGENAQFLAALTIKIQDKENERTEFCKKINSEIKKLKKEARDIANGLRNALQLDMFDERIQRIATSAPSDGDDGEEGDN